MAYKITDNCINCGACEAECPVSCISSADDKYVINEDDCIDCGACAGVCPTDASEPVESINTFSTVDSQPKISKFSNIEDKWLREN